MYKINEIVDEFLLAFSLAFFSVWILIKFTPQMHLKQPGFTDGACGTFAKNIKIIQKFKETGDTKYIYWNKLDKACFQHDIAYGDFKYLARR